MKKLLVLPLLFGFTSVLNAESYWLVIGKTYCLQGCGIAMEKIEMASMSQCEEQGKKYSSRGNAQGHYCIVGK